MTLSMSALGVSKSNLLSLAVLTPVVNSFIIFRASDVKDLKIEQNAPAEQKPAPMPADPAIVSVRTVFKGHWCSL